MSNSTGMELEKLSFLGPFIGLSVFAEDNVSGYSHITSDQWGNRVLLCFQIEARYKSNSLQYRTCFLTLLIYFRIFNLCYEGQHCGVRKPSSVQGETHDHLQVLLCYASHLLYFNLNTGYLNLYAVLSMPVTDTCFCGHCGLVINNSST